MAFSISRHPLSLIPLCLFFFFVHTNASFLTEVYSFPMFLISCWPLLTGTELWCSVHHCLPRILTGPGLCRQFNIYQKNMECGSLACSLMVRARSALDRRSVSPLPTGKPVLGWGMARPGWERKPGVNFARVMAGDLRRASGPVPRHVHAQDAGPLSPVQAKRLTP